jgi:hypothetical protein
MTAYLELADYLLIAERVLGLPAETIANFDRIGLAESALAAPQADFGGVEAYPDFETKAAVYAGTWSRTIRCWTATSAARSWPPSNSSSATAARGCRHQATRTRPTGSYGPPPTARSAKPTSATGSPCAAGSSGPRSEPLSILSHASHVSLGCTGRSRLRRMKRFAGNPVCGTITPAWASIHS